MLSRQTEDQIQGLLNRFCDLYSQKDLEGVLAITAVDMMGFGTGADEIIRNREEMERQIRRDFDKVDSLSVRLADCTIKAEGTIGWVMGEITFIADGKDIPCRLTMVLRGTGHRWEIVQMHISRPTGDQAEGESSPA